MLLNTGKMVGSCSLHGNCHCFPNTLLFILETETFEIPLRLARHRWCTLISQHLGGAGWKISIVGEPSGAQLLRPCPETKQNKTKPQKQNNGVCAASVMLILMALCLWLRSSFLGFKLFAISLSA